MNYLVLILCIFNFHNVFCGGVFSSLSSGTANQIREQEDQDDAPQLERFANRDLIVEWEDANRVSHHLDYLCSMDNTFNGLKFKIMYSSKFAGRSTGSDYSLEWQDEQANFNLQTDALVRKMQQVNNLTELMILRHLVSHAIFNR